MLLQITMCNLCPQFELTRMAEQIWPVLIRLILCCDVRILTKVLVQVVPSVCFLTPPFFSFRIHACTSIPNYTDTFHTKKITQKSQLPYLLYCLDVGTMLGLLLLPHAFFCCHDHQTHFQWIEDFFNLYLCLSL